MSEICLVLENYDKFLIVLGTRIKSQRLKKKFSQSELSALIDCEIKSIQRIEKGKMNLSLKLFLRLTEALEIPPSELLIFDSLDRELEYNS